MLLYVWWYRRGRDAPVGLIADYLPEPPSDLPAGMAGALIDESADMQDILATILDLARRGVIEIEEVKSPASWASARTTDFIYRKMESRIALRDYEQTLLQKMFGSKSQIELSDLKNKFYSAIPTLRKELYQAVVAEKLFERNPDTVRTQYAVLGRAGPGADGLHQPAVAGHVRRVFGVRHLCADRFGRDRRRHHRPVAASCLAGRPTGADAVARWRAFKRYLENIEKYTKVDDATAIFDRYLPYAVAFGIDKAGSPSSPRSMPPPPPWWIPYGYPRPYYGGGCRPGVAAVDGLRAMPAPMPSEGGRPTLER